MGASQRVEMNLVGKMALSVELAQRAISVKIQQLIGMANWEQDAEMSQVGHVVPHVEREQLAEIVVMERMDCTVTCVGLEFVYAVKTATIKIYPMTHSISILFVSL